MKHAIFLLNKFVLIRKPSRATRAYYQFAHILVSPLVFLSCQSSPLKDFSALKVGMEKGDVLDIMGSPQRTQRFHGKDRWTYVFYEENTRYEKEVHLQNGIATYVGDVWSPPQEKSAESVDMQNDKTHQQSLENLESSAKENKSKQFEEYEQKAKGEDKIRYLPNYKPIK